MKHSIIIILCLLLTFLVKAQDVIHLKNGELINAKVLEVGIKDVKYKKAENISGPTYIIEKNEIKSINYQNGTTENFEVHEYSPPVKQNELLKKVPDFLAKETDLVSLGFGKGFVYEGFNLTIDHWVDKRITLGGSLAIQKFNQYFLSYNLGVSSGICKYNLGFRPLLHFGRTNFTDFYFGGRVGMSYYPRAYDSPFEVSYLPSVQILIGGNLFLNNVLGVNLELGLGAPYGAALGAVFKF